MGAQNFRDGKEFDWIRDSGMKRQEFGIGCPCPSFSFAFFYVLIEQKNTELQIIKKMNYKLA